MNLPSSRKYVPALGVINRQKKQKTATFAVAVFVLISRIRNE